jgi:prevent-host-death family protein
MTQTISISDARATLPELVDKAKDVMGRFIISKNGVPAAILISTQEYESWMETLEITADTKLVKEIRDGIKDVANGQIVPWKDVSSVSGKISNKKSRTN